MNTAPTLGVVTTDRHLAIRGWNDWIAAATGVTEHDALGRPLLDFVAGERAEFYRELLGEVLANGSARVLAPAFHRYLIECRPPDESPHFDHMQQRVTIAALKHDADVVGLMITIEDVTERLDRERAAAEAGDADYAHRAGALVSEDWRIRGEAVRQLQHSATVDELRYLLDTLQRDHHDLSVLNSALRVLIAAGRTVVEPLVQLLNDKAANLRMHAALALGELRAQEATPDLVTSLDDPDENVRFHAIEALGRIGAAESINPLAKIAASDNFFLAFAAIDALSKTDDARVAPLMVSLLGEAYLRPAAIATLAAIGDEDSVPALARSLDHAEAGPVASALVQIHRRYDDTLGAGSFIIETALAAISSTGRAKLFAAVHTPDADRAAVVTVVGWLGREALPTLVSLLGDESLKPAVAAGLLSVGADAVPALIALLGEAASASRAAAAELLGRIGDRRATAPLLTALEDSQAEAALAAAAALGNLGDPAALDGLIAALRHESAAVRRASIAAVNAIGATGTAAQIRSALADPDSRLRESAIRVGGYFGFADCLPAIIAALDDPNEDIRRAAIEQLPVLEDVDAAALLSDALRGETPRNRAAAAHALRLVDDPRVGLALQQALADGDAWVRYFAALSLRDAAGAAPADTLASMAQHDPATHVRIAALQSLGAVNPAHATRVAAEMIDAADDDLAIAAITVLGSGAGADAHAALARATRSPRPAVQLAAVSALGNRPSSDTVEVLEWAARVDDPPGLSAAAIEGLRAIAASAGQAIAQQAAITALRVLAADGARRFDAIAAIARLPEVVIPEIASGLSAARVDVRVATAEALAAMRNHRASSELARALRDEDAAVRSAAVAGFARLGTSSVGRTIAAMRHNDPDEGVRHRAELACLRHGWAIAVLSRP